MRIAVIGSRDFPHMEEVAAFIFEQARDAVIISGGAAGVDTVAIHEARRHRMPYEVYRADWARYGKAAGAIRNREMVERADEVVAFWDGKSKGTKITIDMAKASGKPLRIFGTGSETGAT